jgi:uncharacterized protein (TIGR00369 family)
MPAPETIQTWNDWVLQHPFHRFAGLELVHQEPGKAWCRFEVTQPMANMSGGLHAGLLYGLMDATCYLALIPMLEDDEQAGTVDMNVTLVRPAPVGARVALRAECLRRGRSIAFLRCEAQTAEGGTGTFAVASFTKALGKSTGGGAQA